jgi:transcriptional regulator with XRE-family HTH domain
MAKSKLTRLRERAGIDQRATADLSGIRNYWRLESGAEGNPRIRYLVQLALLFDVPLIEVCERRWYLGDESLFAPSRRIRLDRFEGPTKIAHLRAQRGLTVREVCAGSGLSLGGYTRIEQAWGREEPLDENLQWRPGKKPNPRISDLCRIAVALDVPLADVCEEDWLCWDEYLGSSDADRDEFIEMKTSEDGPPPLVPERWRVKLR